FTRTQCGLFFFCWLSEADAVRAGLYTEDTAYSSSCQIKLCEQYIHIYYAFYLLALWTGPFEF
ncbi:hypothetical protein M378DRAFT_162211, partial [Amanita muscaria Koide BX008]